MQYAPTMGEYSHIVEVLPTLWECSPHCGSAPHIVGALPHYGSTPSMWEYPDIGVYPDISCGQVVLPWFLWAHVWLPATGVPRLIVGSKSTQTRPLVDLSTSSPLLCGQVSTTAGPVWTRLRRAGLLCGLVSPQLGCEIMWPEAKHGPTETRARGSMNCGQG